MRINEVTYEKLKTPLKVNGNLEEEQHLKSNFLGSTLRRDRRYLCCNLENINLNHSGTAP